MDAEGGSDRTPLKMDAGQVHVASNASSAHGASFAERCAALRERPKHAAAVAALVGIAAVVTLAARGTLVPEWSSAGGTVGGAGGEGAGAGGGAGGGQQLSTGPLQATRKLRSVLCGELATAADTAGFDAAKCDCLGLTDPVQVSRGFPLLSSHACA